MILYLIFARIKIKYTTDAFALFREQKMNRKRFIAIHTFHSEDSKKAFQAMNSEDTQTEEEWFETWTFENCQCVATWVGDDDFFFCHWLSESDQNIHKALTAMGLDEFVFTACYETPMYSDINFLPDNSSAKRALSKLTVDA